MTESKWASILERQMDRDQAEIDRLRKALGAGVELVADLTKWGGNCGGLPQTLQDRADWWRLDVDPLLARLDGAS